MKLIDEAGKAWRMFSVQAMLVAGALEAAWLAMPPDLVARVPDNVRSGVTIALLAFGVAGRLVKQDRVSGE